MLRLQQFYQSHRQELHCQLAAPTVISLWFDNDDDGAKIEAMRDILLTEYHAQLTGPTTQGVPGKPNMLSFTFPSLSSIKAIQRVIPSWPEMFPLDLLRDTR